MDKIQFEINGFYDGCKIVKLFKCTFLKNDDFYTVDKYYPIVMIDSNNYVLMDDMMDIYDGYFPKQEMVSLLENIGYLENLVLEPVEFLYAIGQIVTIELDYEVELI